MRQRGALCGLLVVAAGCAAEAEVPDKARTTAVAATAESADLTALREATRRFQDVEVALAEGYIPDPTGMCVTAALEGQPAQLGGMGIHYFRPDLLGITATAPRVAGTGTHTEFSQPGVLIYVPQADGSLRLAAIENLVFQEAWHAAGNTSAPVYDGNEYYGMVDNPLTPMDEAHGFEPHYELHVWLHQDNPAGVFTPFNPAVSCEHAGMHPVG